MHDEEEQDEAPRPIVTNDTLSNAINHRTRHVARFGRFHGLTRTTAHLSLIRAAAEAEIASEAPGLYHVPSDLIPEAENGRQTVYIPDPAFTRLREALSRAIELRRYR